jgi:hypothetical protein
VELSRPSLSGSIVTEETDYSLAFGAAFVFAGFAGVAFLAGAAFFTGAAFLAAKFAALTPLATFYLKGCKP